MYPSRGDSPARPLLCRSLPRSLAPRTGPSVSAEDTAAAVVLCPRQRTIGWRGPTAHLVRYVCDMTPVETRLLLQCEYECGSRSSTANGRQANHCRSHIRVVAEPRGSPSVRSCAPRLGAVHLVSCGNVQPRGPSTVSATRGLNPQSAGSSQDRLHARGIFLL